MTSPYSKYIIPCKSIVEPRSSAENSKIETLNSNFSREAGFKKIGAHHAELPPGSRTSLPHAESVEEEFVFVVSGEPHVWIDGYVYLLKPNVAVGFPAGTGIAHCFINNTESSVELLVFGERTKKENLCSLPVNPDQKTGCEIWWRDTPERPLGPHSGFPGPVKPSELGQEWPSHIFDCEKLKLSCGWHYPGDSETFGESSRLTDLIGLKALGIGYEKLLPGKRSAFPHAHKTEEEFAFILSGTAKIWMNGFMHEAPTGTAVCFVPGTNIAHCLVNDSGAPMTYLIVGEANDENNEDRIFYPQHPFRNAQCLLKKVLWEDRPLNIEMDEHKGRPQAGLSEHLALRHFSGDDHSAVLEVFLKSPTYFHRVDGCEPTLKSVELALSDGPKKRTPTYSKEFLLLDHKDQSIGVVDLHIDHPHAGIAYIGLLLLTENMFSKGLGRKFYDLVEHYVKTTFGIKTMRLGVSGDNDVTGYWNKMGFSPNGNSYEWKGEHKITDVVEFEKSLAT